MHMLEVKAPWDQKVIQKIKYQKTNDIEDNFRISKKKFS